ncbi:MAG: hypothetical protein JSS82_14190 [Bacteroidetes bacterium]|nr:hypothetical protein [Bacteroidota bacterium]
MTIRTVIAIMLCACLQSCYRAPVPNYVGVYQLDITASKLGKYATIDSIQDLKLIISKDSTFHFSKDAPFILQQNGTWTLEYRKPLDLPPYYRCSFYYGKNHRDDDLRPMDDGVMVFYFNYPLSKDSEESVEQLQFERIK